MADPVLDDYQFELSGYVFGYGRPIYPDGDGGFDPGPVQKQTQDGTNPRTGSRVFGRDMRGAATWTWALHVDRTDAESALSELSAMAGVWLDEQWNEPGAVAELRYAVAGRTRRVFGRPRSYDYSMNNRLLGGYLPPMATFDLADAKTYSDVEHEIELSLVASTEGGFTAPFEAPLSIDLGPDWSPPGYLLNAGNTSSSFAVVFEGPVTNPRVVIGTAVIGLDGTLAGGASVTVNAHPWAMTIERSGDTGGATLTRDTRLTRALVGPGAHQAVYSGVDYSGTSRARVRWHDAYNTF